MEVRNVFIVCRTFRTIGEVARALACRHVVFVSAGGRTGGELRVDFPEAPAPAKIVVLDPELVLTFDNPVIDVDIAVVVVIGDDPFRIGRPEGLRKNQAVVRIDGFDELRFDLVNKLDQIGLESGGRPDENGVVRVAVGSDTRQNTQGRRNTGKEPVVRRALFERAALVVLDADQDPLVGVAVLVRVLVFVAARVPEPLVAEHHTDGDVLRRWITVRVV